MRSKAISIEISETPRPLAEVSGVTPLLAELWRSQVLLCCLRTFVVLHLADVLGAEALAVDEICRRARLKHVDGVDALLRALKGVDVVDLDDETRLWRLTDIGADLQNKVDGNRTPLATLLTGSEVLEGLQQQPVHLVEARATVNPALVRQMLPFDVETGRELDCLRALQPLAMSATPVDDYAELAGEIRPSGLDDGPRRRDAG